jgi:hypothetical protein
MLLAPASGTIWVLSRAIPGAPVVRYLSEKGPKTTGFKGFDTEVKLWECALMQYKDYTFPLCTFTVRIGLRERTKVAF